MTDVASTPGKPQKHRSPSYPAIDLKTAVGRIHEVNKIAGSRPAAMAVIIKAWGYGAKSSNGILTMAALKKYGLATDTGRGDTRNLQLTLLAQEIVFYPEDTGEWLELIRLAAVKPTIYRDLWKKYGPDLVDDSVMLHHLRFEKGFSDSAGREVLRHFRATAAYARLAEAGDILSGDEPEDDPDAITDGDDLSMTTPAVLAPAGLETPTNRQQQSRKGRTVQITYSPSEWALLQGQFPMSEDDWDAMIAVLQAMKRGLVVPSDPE